MSHSLAFRPSGRASALLLLAVQLLLGALPHSERVPGRIDRLGASPAASAFQHAPGCQACVLGHAPAAPASLAAEVPPVTSPIPAMAGTPSTRHPATRLATRSRAPPPSAL